MFWSMRLWNINNHNFKLTEMGRKYVDRATHLLVKSTGFGFAPFKTEAEYDVAYYLYSKAEGSSPQQMAKPLRLPIWKTRSICIDLRKTGLIERTKLPMHMLDADLFQRMRHTNGKLFYTSQGAKK